MELGGPPTAPLWPSGPVLMLDCFSVLFRALFALPPMSTREGVPTAGAYGMSSLLLKLLREQRPSALLFAVDEPGPTFRHLRLESYKATRSKSADGFAIPSAHLAALAESFETPLLSAPGFEADDVLATCAVQVETIGKQSLVISGDRDLLQLASASTRILFIGRRGKPHVLYDEAAVRRRFGVAPEQLPTWVALVGDPSDNLPGVPGIGPKTAAGLVSRFDNAEVLLARLGEVNSLRLRRSLDAHRDQLVRVEQLARLRTDVPVVARLGVVSATAVSRLSALFAALEFQSLLPRLSAVVATE
jgi:DNA polymerase I